jgi:crotonobetainyl-CoA:carnitine CoA-transferase CaiB-like acyl-CoA transferase
VSGPLDDLVVVELANWVAGPSATVLMADMGATVIKVEPPTGDSMRNKLRQPRWPEGVEGTDVVFQLDNRGKRSIAVDLGDPRGRGVVVELVATADVVVSNLTRSRLDRYGLGPDAMLARHPRLIYGLVSGQGSTGPDADRLAFDVTAFFGRGGVTGLLGEPGGPPVQPRPGQGDHPTGLALFAALLAALRVRDRTGEGQLVETALMRVGAWTVGVDLAAALVDRRQPTKRSREHPISPMNTMYRCADGAWLILSAHDAATWGALCRAVGRPELAEDERFATAAGRFGHAEELVGIFEEVFGAHPYDHWAAHLGPTGIIFSKMAELTEVIDDPQARAMSMFTELEHPAIGRFETLAAPFSLSRSQVAARGPAPEIGQDTISVLAEHLKMADGEIQALIDAGVVTQAGPPAGHSGSGRSVSG